MTRLRSVVLLLLAAAALLPARADALDLKQRYERQLLRWALGQTGLQLEPRPAGKTIERVVIVREEIIAESDFWPNFFNWFHLKTRDQVVRQELLIGTGETWDPARVAESARNLRKLFILAVVRVVPCKSSKPGQVVLLVVTKDLWSIRLNMRFTQVGSIVQEFLFQPTEQNFLGRNKQVSLRLMLRQFNFDGGTLSDWFLLGQEYIDHRLLGSRLFFRERLDLLLSGDVPCGGARGGAPALWCPARQLGDVEGVSGLLHLRRPLYSLATRWGFDLWGQATVLQQRYFRQPGPVLRTARFERHPDGVVRDVPRVYDRLELVSGASLVRSFGHAVKHDVTAGLVTYRFHYSAPDGFPFDAQTRAWYLGGFVPRSEDATYLFMRYRTRATRYIKLRHLDTFALTEDYLLGHDVRLEARFASALSDPTQGYIEGRLNARYRWHFRGNLLTAEVAARSRYQPGVEQLGVHGSLVNTKLDLSLKDASPRLWIGRVHLRLRSVQRLNNLNKETTFLGGDKGLRGYPSVQFEGNNLLLVNVEYRSLPINFKTLHLGFNLFYDGGGVYGTPVPGREQPLVWRQSVGLGLRALFPQFDREVLRVDLGFPLSSGAGEFGTWISASFRQVWDTQPR